MLKLLSLLVAAFALTQGVVGFQPLARVPSRLPALNMAAKDHEFTVAILGDLHLDPRYMEDHVNGEGASRGAAALLCYFILFLTHYQIYMLSLTITT